MERMPFSSAWQVPLPSTAIGIDASPSDGLLRVLPAPLNPPLNQGAPTAPSQSAATCTARAGRVGAATITWHPGPREDMLPLEQWCRGVGPPLVAPASNGGGGHVPPSLQDLVVVTWNAHLAEGRLADLVGDLRRGRFTGGRPVAHFVLLLQELFRRGDDVPPLAPDARSAFAIAPRDARAPDARDYATSLGLAMLYVPSMRNGAGSLEDRGNAIVSSEPLLDALALELPFERQRRVAVGAAIGVRTARGTERLQLLNAHLEPLSSPSSLWLFRNPRRRQMSAILDLVRSSRFDDEATSVGAIVGGDFNTIQGGAGEDAYRDAHAWTRGLVAEDQRSTHFMGRLDYLLVRLSSDWAANTIRVDDKYGSDHHPVLGRFQRVARTRNMW